MPPRTLRSRIAPVTAAVFIAAVMAACNPQNAQQLSVSPHAPLISSIVPPDKSVVIDAVAGAPQANNGMDFNGYFAGNATLTIPEGWQVTIECKNIGIIHHNCAIVDDNTSSPLGGRIQFNAISNPNPAVGLEPNNSDSFTFTAAKAGSYRLACIIPGHEDEGMWINFDISSTAAVPTFTKNAPLKG